MVLKQLDLCTEQNIQSCWDKVPKLDLHGYSLTESNQNSKKIYK